MSTSALPPSKDNYKFKQASYATSSTLLIGLEQAVVPVTKPVVNKKPSIAASQWKPLPPPPSMLMRRASHNSTHGSPTADHSSRSSSIYSDVYSAWYDSTNQELASRAAFYEANRTNPRASMSEPQLLLPRTYRPLLADPSPAVSPDDSPSRTIHPLTQRPSELLPPPIASPELPRDKLQTVSLAQAQAMLNAPGSLHYLPEELRARKLAKSRSTENVASSNSQVANRPLKPGSTYKPHESPTMRLPSLIMLDAGTWHGFDRSKHKASPLEKRPGTADQQTLDKSRWLSSSTTAQKERKDSEQPRMPSYEKYTAEEFQRGRTRQRVPREAAPNRVRQSSRTAEQIAAEYTSILFSPDDVVANDPHSQENQALGLGIGQNTPFLKHIISKPTTSLVEELPSMAYRNLKHLQQQSSTSSISPKQTSRRDQSTVPSKLTVDSHSNSPPPPLFLFPDSDSEEGTDQLGVDSRTGSIPISAPFDNGLSRPQESDFSTAPDLSRPPLPPSPTLPSSPPADVVAALAQFSTESQADTKAKRKARESAYYPYIGRRKHDKHELRSRAQQAKPASKISHVSRPNSKARSVRRSASTRKHGDVPIIGSRLVHKAAQITDQLGRSSDSSQSPPGRVSPEYPHLCSSSPANLSQSVTAVYLGWSEESKEDFDASKPVSPKHHYAARTFSPKPTIKPMYEHVVAPPRPLDERTVNLASDQPTVRGRTSRSGSIFGSLLELRKEKGRERRREDIKKTIRVLPNAPAGACRVTRPELAEKSASDAGVPTKQSGETAPQLGVWGRRLSEFGMI